MALRRARTRRRISITSLIDVIFLLLLFFMLASSFTHISELEVSAPVPRGASSAAPSADARVLLVGQTRLSLDGRHIADAALPHALRAGLPEHDTVTLRVSDDADTQRLTDILALLQPIDGLAVSMTGAAP
ncbi:biopolymer transporter ExbD [Stakelama tenebrarum]|uniref:Biopolymer transporter ExbD n=1 Tax=Stakelama tenebrarum TaxID=2711215 RepID=A0A6G6Y1D6_9SPHN|nr:biopolymer transporter ExbD [Sphingosinithalassobacter tenebrarum]QIG78754.1 biopolymer transporter ExbD [Sphingosinithalassobacter tenebrarum]